MHKPWLGAALSFSLALGLSPALHADVYRWTDAQGKVHFGDNKPKAAVPADNITEQVKKTNRDTSGDEHEKMAQLFRKQNAADREYQQQQATPDPELLKRCAEARKYLATISGRVQFLDDDGKPIPVTEEMRSKRVNEVKKTISNYCPAP